MKAFTEFISTYIFVTVIALVSAQNSALGAIGVGVTLIALVYASGHRSGAHFNPAVSFALLIKGKMTVQEFIGYVVAQVVAGLLAFETGFYLTGQIAAAPAVLTDVTHALVVEIIFTTLLVLTIFNVAASKKTEGNSFYGVAIGLAVMGGAIAGGPISGGSFNPAVGMGSILVRYANGMGNLNNIWIPIVGPLLGAAIAAAVWSIQETTSE